MLERQIARSKLILCVLVCPQKAIVSSHKRINK